MWRKRPWRRLVTSPPTLQQKYVERGGLSFSAWFPVGVPTLGAPRPAVGGVGGLSLGRGWWGRLRLSLSTCQMSPVSLSFLAILLAGSRKCWHCQKWSQVPNHFHSQCRLQKVKKADQNVGTGSLYSVPPRSVYGKFNGHTQSSRRLPIRARWVLWGQGGAVASYTEWLGRATLGWSKGRGQDIPGHILAIWNVLRPFTKFIPLWNVLSALVKFICTKFETIHRLSNLMELRCSQVEMRRRLFI